MDAKVKEFLDAARAAERKKFEQARDAHLISLGLTDPEKSRRDYSKLDYYTYSYPNWDEEQKKYYREVNIPVEVTDEEYEEIKRVNSPIVPAEENQIDNGAERFLMVINAIVLTVSVIVAVILSVISLSESNGLFFLSGLGVLIVGLITWAVVKVMLNISNNLHMINSKLK